MRPPGSDADFAEDKGMLNAPLANVLASNDSSPAACLQPGCGKVCPVIRYQP